MTFLLLILKWELYTKYKLLPCKRAFEMIKNDMCITGISQAILSSYDGVKMDDGILKPVENGISRLSELPTSTENDVIVDL